MRFSILLSMLPLALSVAAINVTEPAKGDKLDVSHTFAVKWTSVNTDDSTVDIVLINNNVYPNVEEKIASGVDTSAGSYTVKGLKDVTVGSGFQINLLSTERQNTGILAQSQKFEVTEPDNGPSTTTTGTSSTISSESSSVSSSASTSTGTHTTETDASTTGTSTPGVSIIKPSTGNFTSGSLTTSLPHGKNSTDTSLLTATGTASTGTSTGTNTKTGLTTSATGTSTGTATGSATASPTASEGAAMALVAPGAAAGLLAGFLAFL
ncbi:Cell wall beta-glucan synthesis [Penicillium concentricum]|uniref:Cell wall beta-glucan synthesis n=1 Tax=Penicillium concentricum TaxID=293559 RepID=A0A9W9VKQ4_9EURO|nr:Cell wall beta-glucan synthesis [Penicillium concentricum]KAJ5383140.1 Cell wall beta-glucan synthesis [Penicillium concentricum]